MSHTPTGEQAGDAVPAAQRTGWTSFMKSIASFTGDLSSITAPPFILSPVSLTEFPAYWCERPDLFAAIAKGANPEERAIAVLRWFISTLKDQYTSRNESMGSEKKPLNPVLGELFYGHWPDQPGRGRTDLVVEQVSHHPPITAYHIENKTHGLALQGHNAQKTSFSAGSIIVRQVGHAVLTVHTPDGKQEKYLITLPKLRIDGLWYGSPYIELTESSYIQSSSGWLTTIEYKGKGYFSGTPHSFVAAMTPPPGSSAKHMFKGQWTTTSKDAAGNPFHDVLSAKEALTVAADVATMHELESRRLWEKVARGIREGDYDTASKEKTRIENEQRQLRKDEAAAGTKWELKHFVHEETDPTYELLGHAYKAVPASEDMYVYQNNGPTLP